MSARAVQKHKDRLDADRVGRNELACVALEQRFHFRAESLRFLDELLGDRLGVPGLFHQYRDVRPDGVVRLFSRRFLLFGLIALFTGLYVGRGLGEQPWQLHGAEDDGTCDDDERGQTGETSEVTIQRRPSEDLRRSVGAECLPAWVLGLRGRAVDLATEVVGKVGQDRPRCLNQRRGRTLLGLVEKRFSTCGSLTRLDGMEQVGQPVGKELLVPLYARREVEVSAAMVVRGVGLEVGEKEPEQDTRIADASHQVPFGFNLWERAYAER